MTDAASSQQGDEPTELPGLSLFHGRFIPDDPDRPPLPKQLTIGIGLAVAILVLAFICMNTLNSLGVWVTLLLVSVLTASALVLWIWDTLRHPPGVGEDK